MDYKTFKDFKDTKIYEDIKDKKLYFMSMFKHKPCYELKEFPNYRIGFTGETYRTDFERECKLIDMEEIESVEVYYKKDKKGFDKVYIDIEL